MELSNIESIWLQINTDDNGQILVNFTYRPPNSPQSWIDEYEKQLILAESSNLDCFAIGDYNINFSPPHSFSNSKWSKVVCDFGLDQLVNTPTRVTKSSSSIIDHIYTTATNYISEIFVSEISVSDHFPVAFTLSKKCNIKHSNRHKAITYRSFKNFDKSSFLHDIYGVNFDILETISDTNLFLDKLYYMLNCVLDKHAPLKCKRVKRLQQPGWYTDEVKQARITRDMYRSHKNWDQYKIWRNKCVSIIKKTKKSFFNNSVKDKKDAKFLWKNIKLVSNENEQCISVPNTLKINDTITEGMQNIADALNDYFVNIAKTTEKSQFNAENFISLQRFLDMKLQNSSFDIDFITPHEVSILIEKLDTNKSSWLDKIGPNILKLCKDQVALPIATLINYSISSGVFPDKLKEAGVVPLHKGGAKMTRIIIDLSLFCQRCLKYSKDTLLIN